MIQNEINSIVRSQIKECLCMLEQKEKEYAKESRDRLSHFKKAAAFMNSTPKAALMGMLAKHIVSV